MQSESTLGCSNSRDQIECLRFVCLPMLTHGCDLPSPLTDHHLSSSLRRLRTTSAMSMSNSTMDSTNLKAARPSLCSLPIEIKQVILYHLTDLSTLKAAILSHSTIYSAFTNKKASITIQVSLNSIPQDLFPDAVFAFHASTIEGWTWSRRAMTQDWTRERVLSILDYHRNDRLPRTISLKEAFAMKKLYRVIKFFTSDFIAAALARKPSTLPQHPPSSQEWNRVARSFYRFEIYRHLFRMRDRCDYPGFDREKRPKRSLDFKEEEQWEVYYRHCAVWELEQLASVSEYLFRRTAIRKSTTVYLYQRCSWANDYIAFNEIAAHDVYWGSSGINYDVNEAWELSRRYSYIPGLVRPSSWAITDPQSN